MKKIFTLALAALLVMALAVAVNAEDTENWIAGNGYNVVNSERKIVEENSPVTAIEKSATEVEVTHGGYYQDGLNWGGVASKSAYNLDGLKVKVTFTKVPQVDESTDCWIYIGVLSKPQMFQVSDITGNPGYVNLIRFANKYLQVYDGIYNFSSMEILSGENEMFAIKSGDEITVEFVKNSSDAYFVKYTIGENTVTTTKEIDLDAALKGKGHVVVSASRIECEKDAFAYTVEVIPAAEKVEEEQQEQKSEEATEQTKYVAQAGSWIAGNGYNIVDDQGQVVEENSAVSIIEKSATEVEVTHGGYYQNGVNWGGVASNYAYDLENLTIKVTYTKVPAVEDDTDCWMYIGALSKPQMFQVGDIGGNPGYINLIRFAHKMLEVFDVSEWSNVGVIRVVPELFEIKTGDVLTVQFVKDTDGLYRIKYTKGDLIYTTDVKFDLDKHLGGKGYVVVSASRIASEKDAFAYTVEINPAPEAPEVSVFLDGNKIKFEEQSPVIVEERTLVPLRAIFEALDAEVQWDDTTKTVTATRGEDTIKLTIGDTKLYKNGQPIYELDVPAQIMGDGFTMVPARAISESFGCTVDWIGELRAVVITTN